MAAASQNTNLCLAGDKKRRLASEGEIAAGTQIATTHSTTHRALVWEGASVVSVWEGDRLVCVAPGGLSRRRPLREGHGNKRGWCCRLSSLPHSFGHTTALPASPTHEVRLHRVRRRKSMGHASVSPSLAWCGRRGKCPGSRQSEQRVWMLVWGRAGAVRSTSRPTTREEQAMIGGG